MKKLLSTLIYIVYFLILLPFLYRESWIIILILPLLLTLITLYLTPRLRIFLLTFSGRAFVSLTDLRNLWDHFNTVTTEEEIWLTLKKFTSRMLGHTNVSFERYVIPIFKQKAFIDQYSIDLTQNECFLKDDDTESYIQTISTFTGYDLHSDRNKYILPLMTRENWYGHIAMNRKARKQLKDREYQKIFNMVLNQGISLVEKTKIVNLTKAQSATLEKLLTLSKNISEIVDLDILLDKILYTLDEIIPFDAGGIFLVDDKYEYFYARKIKGYTQPDVGNLNVKLEVGIIGKAIREKKTIILEDAKTDPNYYNLREETHSQLTTPLFVGDEVIGVFSLESNQSNYFESHDIEYLDGFAGIAAIAIRNAKLFRDSEMKNFLETEMLNAAQVQSALLPKQYSIPEGYDIYSINIPSLQVGGDIFELGGPPEDYLIAIGDVSGKGTSGAILMAVLFAGLRSTLKVFWEVGKNLERLNQLMVESTVPGKFATFFMAKMNAKTDELWYSNAGHNAPLLISANDLVTQLDKGGTVLGFVKNTRYEEALIHLQKGDIIVFFTDGLEEAMNSDEIEYGKEKIIEIIRRNREKNAKELVAKLISDAKKWVGKNELQDDLTLIVLKKL